MAVLVVIGGGLSGSEAAWQAAQRGVHVELYEMRPMVATGAHTSSLLAEVVCSNSLGSNRRNTASGLLKEELRLLGSLLLKCAEETSLPAGDALAVDREGFARLVTSRIAAHPRIRVIRQEVTEIPATPAIIATGPLTSANLSSAIQKLLGSDHLYFYDAISPIVQRDSINLDVAFRASRYDRGETENGDYLNCPMTRDEYEAFVEVLLKAERIELREFEQDVEWGVRAGIHRYFEACLPIEIIAQRGWKALAFGPLRPVGLTDPRSGKRPYAVVQLRQDNLAGTLYNMVGFQTNLTYTEQRRVFRMIPGLEHAEFTRYGQMHRNTFINSPAHLLPSLQFRGREDLFFAGQISGVEGYVGNIATGLLAGVNAARVLEGQPPLVLPPTCMLGAMCRYISNASPADFQPMKANFSLLPGFGEIVKGGRRERVEAYVERALEVLREYVEMEVIR